ncbi:hypothetical protein BRL95_03680 [Xanthomonas oryzae pv. oryzae]|nr:hypothetical protein BRL95_03680 [Xanthomonas oryzae pv. oryzae]
MPVKIFRFLDDFIVVIAKVVIRAVFAVGTGLVYIQFIGGLLLTLAFGTSALVLVFAAVRRAVLGA